MQLEPEFVAPALSQVLGEAAISGAHGARGAETAEGVCRMLDTVAGEDARNGRYERMPAADRPDHRRREVSCLCCGSLVPSVLLRVPSILSGLHHHWAARTDHRRNSK